MAASTSNGLNPQAGSARIAAGAVDIVGPAGNLEAVLRLPEGAPRAVAVVLHPHPLYDGTMNNKVVVMLQRAMLDSGMAALRFNFRGVGRSGGQHDNGVGEVDDALAAVNWLQSRYPDLPLVVGGFSFGAATAVRLRTRHKVDALITAGLPARYFKDEHVGGINCPWLLVHGEADDVAPWPAAREWAASLNAPQLQMQSWPDAGHFFHGHTVSLRNTVRQWLDGREFPNTSLSA